jgi:regulator of nucleoside diphosphate kinase
MNISVSEPNNSMPVIGVTDYRALTRLALEALSKNFDVAAELSEKLENTWVLPNEQVSHDIVRMGSTVTYKVEGFTRTITLAYPDEADAEAGQISILTPIGAALLGLRPGQEVVWASRNGQRNSLTIDTVVRGVLASLAS